MGAGVTIVGAGVTEEQSDGGETAYVRRRRTDGVGLTA